VQPGRSSHPNGFLSRFVRDQRGVSAIVFAIVLPVLIGFVGIGVEMGQWFHRKRSMQAAADAGAMAGALVLYQGGTWADAQTAASDFAVRNGAVAANVTSNNPPTSGSYTADANAVEVLVTESQTRLFSAIFLTSDVTVNARAVATAGTQALGCVVALNSSASEAVHLDGNAYMDLNGCGLTVNSSASNALTMDNNSDLYADFGRITGNYDLNNNASVNSTPMSTGATATTDPYASLTNPTPSGACTETNYSLGANQTDTIGPGRYCGGFNMASNSSVTMTTGTYYIDGGSFTMSSNTTLTATSGVTIILTGSGVNFAELNINSNAVISITAPTTGTYAGIAIMHDQDATTTNTLDSNVTITVTGALYFPNSQLHMDSNTVIQSTGSGTTGCGLIIADTIHLDSNAHITLNSSSANCDAAGVPTTTTASPTLVE
jgi:Flp pilus assembly protein TadG